MNYFICFKSERGSFTCSCSVEEMSEIAESVGSAHVKDKTDANEVLLEELTEAEKSLENAAFQALHPSYEANVQRNNWQRRNLDRPRKHGGEKNGSHLNFGRRDNN